MPLHWPKACPCGHAPYCIVQHLLMESSLFVAAWWGALSLSSAPGDPLPDSDDRDGSNQVSVSRASHKSQHRPSVLTRTAGGNDRIKKNWKAAIWWALLTISQPYIINAFWVFDDMASTQQTNDDMLSTWNSCALSLRICNRENPTILGAHLATIKHQCTWTPTPFQTTPIRQQ